MRDAGDSLSGGCGPHGRWHGVKLRWDEGGGKAGAVMFNLLMASGGCESWAHGDFEFKYKREEPRTVGRLKSKPNARPVSRVYQLQ